MQDYPKEVLDFLVDLEKADEVIEDMTSDRVTPIEEETTPPTDDPPMEEEPQEAEVIENWHVQIRIEEPGPPKGDGRRGRILIEDTSAPTSVVRWLSSTRCAKADRSTGKPIYIWINQDMLGNESVSIPNADASQRAGVALRGPADSASLQLLGAYQSRLEGQIEALELELIKTRRRCEEEAQAARDARDREINICSALVEQARLRVQKELGREDQEIEAINARRSVISNQRTDLAGDLNSFQTVMQDLKEKMSGPEKEEAGIVDRVADMIKLANDEGIQSGIGSILQMYFKAKEKTGNAP